MFGIISHQMFYSQQFVSLINKQELASFRSTNFGSVMKYCTVTDTDTSELNSTKNIHNLLPTINRLFTFSRKMIMNLATYQKILLQEMFLWRNTLEKLLSHTHKIQFYLPIICTLKPVLITRLAGLINGVSFVVLKCNLFTIFTTKFK